MSLRETSRAALAFVVSAALICTGYPSWALGDPIRAPVLDSASGSSVVSQVSDELVDDGCLAASGNAEGQGELSGILDPPAQEDSGASPDVAASLDAGEPQTVSSSGTEPLPSDHRVLVGMRGGHASFGSGQVLSSHGELYLLGYESEEAADAAVRDLSGRQDVDFAARDIGFSMASDDLGGEASQPSQALEDSDGDPVVDLEQLGNCVVRNTSAEPLIALIDSGVPARECVVGRTSVIGDDPSDECGHGTLMLNEMQEIVPNGLRVLSIKALNADGRGTAASIYAAIVQAIEAGATVINLSLSACSCEENAAVADAVSLATKAGILVVASAGNHGADASYFVPGNLDEVLCAGALESEGKARGDSNYGSVVDAWVLADSTSQAAARLSAWLAYNSSFAQAREDLESVRAQLKGIFGPEGVSTHADGIDDAQELLSLVPDASDPAFSASSSQVPVVRGRAYVHELGAEGAWTDWVSNEAKSEADRADWNDCGGDGYISAVQFSLVSSGSYSGGIEYGLYPGDPAADGATSGDASATGTAASKLYLRFTGELANHYDIVYQVHDRELTGGMESLPRNGEWAQHSGLGIDRIAWNPIRKSWTVRYVDGSSVLKTQVVEDGCSASAPELPTREGYLSSWSRDSANICADTTISVVYEPEPIETARQRLLVRYQDADGDYGAYETVLDEDYPLGSTCSWSRPQDDIYQQASLTYEVQGESTHYVDVMRNTATLVFEGNGATGGAMAELASYAGAQLTLPDCTYTRTGYAFSGWNSQPDGSGTSYDGQVSVEGGSLTLYAQWQIQQLSVTVPVALCYVADEDGTVTGPLDATVSLSNTGEADVGVVRMEACLNDPWNLVAQGQVTQDTDVSLGLRFGEGQRLDFSQLSQTAEPYVRIGAQKSVFVNDLTGSMGAAPSQESSLGYLRWHFAAV